MQDVTKRVKMLRVLFVVYLIALFEIVVFKFDIPFSNMGYLRSVNFIPFNQSLIVNGKIELSEIFMNMVIFIPLGVYFEIIFSKWSTMKKVFIVFVVSLSCEILQFIMAVGASDITDVINNTLGGIVGVLIIKLLIRLFKDKNKVYKFINIVATAGTVFMISLLSMILLYNR